MSSGPDVARVTEKVVHNFFTPASKKPPEAVTWSVHDGTLLRGRYNVDSEAHDDGDDDDRIVARRPAKVAAFDFVSSSEGFFSFSFSWK